MAQFDVMHIRTGGLVVDVQSDLLDPLNTRIVVPLLLQEAGLRPAKYLNPEFEIDGTPYVFAPQLLAAVRVSELGDPVDTLGPARDTITRALDMLFQGF